mmetsp:Transcript_8599/g.26918  ORF Transcript_8599/g.26918 Transcript_8599/m.26918 type:complete len:244 (-) Transcript_8599:44-775(-)
MKPRSGSACFSLDWPSCRTFPGTRRSSRILSPIVFGCGTPSSSNSSGAFWPRGEATRRRRSDRRCSEGTMSEIPAQRTLPLKPRRRSGTTKQSRRRFPRRRRRRLARRLVRIERRSELTSSVWRRGKRRRSCEGQRSRRRPRRSGMKRKHELMRRGAPSGESRDVARIARLRCFDEERRRHYYSVSHERSRATEGSLMKSRGGCGSGEESRTQARLSSDRPGRGPRRWRGLARTRENRVTWHC